MLDRKGFAAFDVRKDWVSLHGGLGSWEEQVEDPDVQVNSRIRHACNPKGVIEFMHVEAQEWRRLKQKIVVLHVDRESGQLGGSLCV